MTRASTSEGGGAVTYSSSSSFGQGQGAPAAGQYLSRRGEGASFIDASAGGSDAFFLTDGSLVPSDPGSVDLYDAREGGGFAQPGTPTPCEADACQSLPSEPEDPTPGTSVPNQGNPPVHFPKPGCPKGTHRARRHGKPRCVGNHHRKHRGRR